MGYAAWVIAFVGLLFMNTVGMAPSIVISNLLQIYLTVNIISTVIMVIILLLSLLSDIESEYMSLFGIAFLLRVILLIAAFLMAGSAGAEGITNPVLFGIMLVFSIFFGRF